MGDSKSMYEFTVLMAVYHKDDPRLFDLALDSIFLNTLQPNCVLLVCDGPLTPLLDSIILKFYELHKSVFNIIRTPLNMGLASALNHGLKFVKTEWVVRADADDINHHDRFNCLIGYLSRNPELTLLGSFVDECEPDGRFIAQKSVPLDEISIKKYMLRRNPFNHMSVVFKTKAALSVGGYPNIYLKEDYAMWIQMICNGSVSRNISLSLVFATTGSQMYRRRGGIKYAKSEIPLQKIFVHYGLKSPFIALLDGALRSIVYLLPNQLRMYFYLRFLRRKGTV